MEEAALHYIGIICCYAPTSGCRGRASLYLSRCRGIHISDLSWTKKIKTSLEFTQGQRHRGAGAREIDKDNRRLSLGHKQLEENPLGQLRVEITVGSIHQEP